METVQTRCNAYREDKEPNIGKITDDNINKLSVIIPAYNEEKRIGKTLESYLGFFHDIEILIAIDGNDKTLDIVKSFSENGNKNNNSISYIHSDKRLGKGMGILHGFNHVKGDIIAITDADESTSPCEIYKLINQLDGGYDCVIGSRWLPESKILIKQPLKRMIASRCFNYIVRHTLDIPFTDTQCGSKVFRKEAIKYATERMSTFDFAFDIDLLYQLHKGGFKIKEVPITWNDKDGSSIKLFRTSILMFLSVVRLRIINSYFRFLVKNDRMYKYIRRQK